MPGVSISTAVRTGPVNTGTAPASTFFLIGETERGIDNAPILVTSLAEYETAFGGYEAGKHTYQQVRTFFEEGGVKAYISRATASDSEAVKASKALLAEGDAAGITLTAVGVGAWGNNLNVLVTNATTTYTITIYYGGTTSPYQLFTGTYATLNAGIEAINSSTVLANYCTAALTSTANGAHQLAAFSVGAFTSGDDGTITASNFTSRLNGTSTITGFYPELGAGCVAIPGLADGTGDDEAVWGPIAAHCAANNRIGLLSFASGVSVSTAVSTSEAYGSSDDTNHEFIAFFHPWVKIPSGSGTTLTVSPEAYVAAIRSKTQNQVGTWKPYAGNASEARFVNGTAIAIGRADNDTLDAARVNAIRVINNTIRIYGARSHSTNTDQWRFITHRETINYIADRCSSALESLLFSSLDGRKAIYAQVRSTIQGVMEPIRIAGGLYEGFDTNGKQIDYGYTIKIDDSINPLSQIESGLIKAQVGVRVSTVGDKIEVSVTKSNLTATLV